ncbi:anti-repressor SinI family protein [Metabacillus fastidiosus]|uniref:Anti-repressor SinI family protein n=1 Tax=Metabacillus fastidiosus TaxID=1458 RepID=A0ABU6NW22_9BACI|nr:anti-repressor SinI family protein [Metabacillus fastidiosus]MED4401325.1 anti-repressor SinI family protein [Metabacillus fastidiosus]MED4453088.1 anti-repressor SinI family protein [Metabacillus fastidiosus]MED4461723.1 anti-repressor SinI family protein [Metabacillus fastidiosus]
MKLEEKVLDKEWQELILIAINTSITAEEIKKFFSQSSKSP